MRIASTLSLLLVIGAQLQAQAQSDSTVAPETELVKLLRPYYLEQARDYRFSPADASGDAFKFVDEPVMSWTGRESGSVTSGDVFVWTRDGRAEVIGCIGSTPSGENRYNFHEFHSLSGGPLAAVQLANGRTWEAQSAGVELKPVPGAPPPADTRARRLVGMRQLARQFGGRMLTNTGEREQLRLLPQPIFRYPGDDLQARESPVVDGAIFAYVWTQGTDPELLLLVECHEGENGLTWLYAPVRFTYRELWLDHNEKEVWHVEVDAGHDYIGPYLTVGTGVRSVEQIRVMLESRDGK